MPSPSPSPPRGVGLLAPPARGRGTSPYLSPGLSPAQTSSPKPSPSPDCLAPHEGLSATPPARGRAAASPTSSPGLELKPFRHHALTASYGPSLSPGRRPATRSPCRSEPGPGPRRRIQHAPHDAALHGEPRSGGRGGDVEPAFSLRDLQVPPSCPAGPSLWGRDLPFLRA